MGTLELVARAETSDDLKHHERFCDVDVLGAVGMSAATTPMYMALYRLKYINDYAEMKQCRTIFIKWSAAALQRRKLDPTIASRFGVQVLMYWLDELCGTCDGRGYAVIEGTPSLSDRKCPACGGSGKKQAPVTRDLLPAAHDVIDRANAGVTNIERLISFKLGRQNA